MAQLIHVRDEPLTLDELDNLVHGVLNGVAASFRGLLVDAGDRIHAEWVIEVAELVGTVLSRALTGLAELRDRRLGPGV